MKLFGNGELNRLIIDALRRANGKPLSTPAIADAIIVAKGYGKEAKHALIRRVRANLSYLLRHRSAVEKTGNRLDGTLVVVGTGKVALAALWPSDGRAA